MSDRWRALRAGGAAAALLLILGSALAPAQAQEEIPVDVPLAEGDFAGYVGIGGGRKIYLECHGEGSPTVILEAGLRSRSDFWSERTEETTSQTVFAGVARFTRVCAYDRPGTTLGTTEFSRSDPVPMPRTVRDAVADLRALIKAGPIPGTYVLAGHSTGGLIVRMYASLYPKRVVGLVLVDALSEFLHRRLTPAQLAAYDELNNGPLPGLEHYADLEQILFRPSFEQMSRIARRHPLAPMPLVVISRGRAFPLPSGLPAGLTTEVVERAWRESQRELATLLPRTRRRIAERSQHYIMFSQPRLIIRSLRRTVDQARRCRRERSGRGGRPRWRVPRRRIGRERGLRSAAALTPAWASRSDCLGALSGESGRLGAGLLTLADDREW
jgi:pimeloyl-ACP methyl ester carboxylesterase